MSNAQPTWSDLLEKARKEVGDESACEHSPPLGLLRTVFCEWKASTQLREFGGVTEPLSSAPDALAWSKDFVYILTENHVGDECITAVRRNPPK